MRVGMGYMRMGLGWYEWGRADMTMGQGWYEGGRG